MTKLETIKYLTENKIKSSEKIVNEVYNNTKELNLTYILTNNKGQYIVHKCKNWEIETQNIYFEKRKEYLKKGYTTEILFNKKQFKGLTKFA